jgi:hypothetical protein
LRDSLTVSRRYLFFYFWGRGRIRPRLLPLILFFLFVIILSNLALAKPAIYHDIEILNSDENGISFVLNLTDPSAYLNAAPNDSGFMAARSVLVGLPLDRIPFISQAVGSEPSTPDKMMLSAGNNNLAEIKSTKSVRGRKIVAINIYPYYQDRFFRRIEVTIDFRKTGTQTNNQRSINNNKIFDAIFRSSILNYEQFKSWPAADYVPAVHKPAVNIFGLTNEWYKIETITEGLIKVTGGDLAAAGVPASALNSNSIFSDSLHMYYGGGNPLLIYDTMSSEPEEMAILVYDGGDGYFNSADYLLFFAQGADSWRYPDDSLPLFIENHYTNINCYWLAISGNFTTGGSRMISENGNPTGGPDSIITRATFYTRQSRNEQLYIENDGHVYDFYNWYWTNEYQHIQSVSLPNAISGEQSIVRARARARDMWLTVGVSAATKISTANWIYRYSTNNIVRGFNSLRFDLDVNSNVGFDYFEIAYQGELTPMGTSNLLDFSLEGGAGQCEMIIDDLNNFSGTPQIFDLSDPLNPVLISTDSLTTAEMKFEADLSSLQNRRFYICPLTRVFSPYRITQVISGDLRAYSSQVDMIVISPEGFVPYLEDYEIYREEKSNINILRVSIEDIMNQFSNGLYDPLAIREFLEYAYLNYYPASPPSAVLLVGDGMFDYEDNLKTGSVNLVPPCIHPGASSASDDNYIFFGQYGALDGDSSYCDTCTDRGYDMMVARWPVRNVSELNTVVEKIRTYESAAAFGSWRTNVTLVADDEYKGTQRDNSRHTEQIENLQKYHLPAAFRRNKIYLWEYDYDSYGNKPDVNDAIVRSLNEGTLVINYVGHGNPDTWAHEHVFNRGTDLQRLNNSDKLALFFAASCSIGFFDEPSRESMAEELLRMPGGGSIGSVTATRLVFSPYNAGFNNQVFDIMFGPDDLSICQSVFASKLLPQLIGDSGQIKNDRKYVYFGDPFLKLGVSQYDINFTSYPDSLIALTTHMVSGEVVEAGSGAPVDDFDGAIEIIVYDTEIEKTYKGEVQSLTYSLPGPLIFRGAAEVVNGSFRFSFIAPLDIGYGGNGAGISAYAMNSKADAFGHLDSLPVSLNISSSSDSAGPAIIYTFSTRENFVPGDKITSDENLRLIISDSSGINLANSAGHAITLIIDNDVENIVNLTDLFQYNAGSFTTGEIEYEIGQLVIGNHRFKVKAWDNANNSSVAEFEASVIRQGSFTMEDLLNYPNPMGEETTFSFALTGPAKKVNLEIFTLSGKRILCYENRNNIPADYHEFYSWNGRDADGDRVATGVYIYKVTAFSQQSDEIVESFGKVVVIN